MLRLQACAKDTDWTVKLRNWSLATNTTKYKLYMELWFVHHQFQLPLPVYALSNVKLTPISPNLAPLETSDRSPDDMKTHPRLVLDMSLSLLSGVFWREWFARDY